MPLARRRLGAWVFAFSRNPTAAWWPSPLGLSLVRLLRREDNILHLAGVDVLDGTPLLDIKPYSPRYDAVENPCGGWTDAIDDATAAAAAFKVEQIFCGRDLLFGA